MTSENAVNQSDHAPGTASENTGPGLDGDPNGGPDSAVAAADDDRLPRSTRPASGLAGERVGGVGRVPGRPARPAKRSRPGGRTAEARDRLLDAAVELIAEGGVMTVTYDAVARRAGASRATVYRKWPDREALIEEALLRFAKTSVDIADTGDLRADIIDFLCQIGDTLNSPVGRAVINATVHAGAGDPIRDLGRSVQDARLSAFQQRLDRAVDEGELPRVDATFLNWMLTGPVYLSVTRGDRVVDRAFAERIVDTVLDGIRPR